MWRGAQCRPMRQTTLPLFGMALLLGACATPAPTPGTPRAEVLRSWGSPTASYPLRDAGQRLEYASGPFGRHTWMIDIDGAGRVAKARQVLSEAEFFQVQSAPQLSSEELLRWIGTPGERRGAHRGGQTWSWRYPTNDCLWFQASISPQGQVSGSAFAIDPACDKGDHARD
jgi:hypothetical protein